MAVRANGVEGGSFLYFVDFPLIESFFETLFIQIPSTKKVR